MTRIFLSLSLLQLLLVTCVTPTRASSEQRYAVKMGFILSLTGQWAEFGEAQVNAIQLAREQHPERFGGIEIITEDCRYNSKEAIAAYEKLRTIDQVDLVFVFGVEPALAVAPIAERQKFPLIVSAVVPSIARGRKNVIRTINYAEQQAQTLLDYFRTRNFRRIALIKAQISFYDILTEGLKENLQDGESLEIIDEVLPTESDFKSIVAKTRSKPIDVLGIFLSPSQILDIYKEIRTQNLEFPLFGASPMQSRTLVKHSEGRMEGTLYVHNDVTKEFEHAYMSRFGQDIQLPWAANTYDFILLAGKSLGGFSKRPAPDQILSALSGGEAEIGAGGPYHFVDSPKEGKYFEYPIVVKKLIDGEFREVFKKTSFK